MAKLHIVSPHVAGRLNPSYVFLGMYGSMEPLPQTPPDEFGHQPAAQVVFRPDPAIARCSTSMQALTRGNEFKLNATDVTTIEGDEDVINAIKANLARALQNNWNRMYDTQLGRSGIPTGYMDDSGSRLVAIPGLGQISQSMLTQALQAERDVANRGIEQLIQNLAGVAPHLVSVNVKNVRIHQGQVYNDGMARIEPSENAAPVQVQTYVTQPDSESGSVLEAVAPSNYVDVTAKVPVYLPTRSGISQTLTRLFNFGSKQPTATYSQPEKAHQVMDLIFSTPVLKRLIVEDFPLSPAHMDMNTAVPAANPPTIAHYHSDFDDDDEGDEDDEDDGGNYDSSHWFSRPAG